MRGLILIVTVVSLLAARPSHGQTGFAASEINRFQSRSSTAAFSSDRIRNSTYSSAVPRTGLGNYASANLFSNALGRANKPFSSVSRGPSVTPYLALNQPFTNSATNYYTLIKPQLEQQRINQQMERQTQQMQRQLSEVTSRAPYDPTGSETMAPTGHTAVYMNYGGYYQTPAPRRK